MENKTKINNDKFFDPKRIKENLITASLFLSYYEILSNTIIGRISNLFNFEYENGKQINSKDYKEDILKRKFKNKQNPFRSSCTWLKEHKAINLGDCKEIIKIKNERNRIAHNLPKFLFDSTFEIKTELMDSIKNITLKIEKWCIINVEIPSNPIFDNINVDYKSIQGGSDLILEYIFNIANMDLNELERGITRILKETK